MNDAFVMRGLQRIGDLFRVAERRLKRERSFGRFPWHQLHHQRALFHAVDLRDVGMVQRRENFGLALKPRETLRVLSESRRQNLDRYFAIKLGVSGPIYFAHAARANRRKNLVGSQTRAGG